MAEKIVLTEIDIDMDKALKDTIRLKEEIGLLTAQTAKAKRESGETSVEYIKYSTALKAATSQLRSHENMLVKVSEAENAEKGSLDQLKAKLSFVTKEWSKLSEEERLSTARGKELTSQKLALSQALKKEEMATGDAHRNVGFYAESLERLPGPLGNATGGVKTFTKSIKVLLANPVVALIAGIVAGLIGLVKVFKSTDSGATEFAARMEQVKAILDVVRQRAVILISAFKDLFSGNFKKAGEEFKQTISGIGDQFHEAAKGAYEYQKSLDAIEDSQNNFISRSAEIKNQVAKLEYTAADRTRSTDERMKALKEAIALSEEEVATVRDLAKKKLDAEAEYLASKTKLRKQDILDFITMTDEEQANASAGLKTARDNNEARFKDLEQYYADWLNTDTAFYNENMANIRKYSGLQKELQEEAKEAALEAKRREAEENIQIARKELDEFLQIATEKKSIQATLKNDLKGIDEEYYALKAEGIKANAENEQAILEQTLMGQLDVEKNKLIACRDNELKMSEKTGASKLLIEKKYAKAIKLIDNAKRDAKLATAQQEMQGIAELFGKSTRIGKAAASASVIIESIRGAQAAMTGMTETFPGPWGIALGAIAAATQLALGAVNVKKIWAVKENGSGGGESGASSGGPVTAVSATGVTQGMVSTQTSIGNGIVSRETVTGETNVPVSQTVLVVDDVTNAQKTESEKVRTSTL